MQLARFEGLILSVLAGRDLEIGEGWDRLRKGTKNLEYHGRSIPDHRPHSRE